MKKLALSLMLLGVVGFTDTYAAKTTKPKRLLLPRRLYWPPIQKTDGSLGDEFSARNGRHLVAFSWRLLRL
jgi:hypothetical protein